VVLFDGGADFVDLVLHCGRNQVLKFILQPVLHVGVVVPPEFLKLDEVLEDLVLVDDLQAVRERVGRLLVDQCEMS